MSDWNWHNQILTDDEHERLLREEKLLEFFLF
jgi:hypothetical protein